MANESIEWTGNYNRNTGEISEYPLTGKWDVWEFEIKSATWIEVTGSLHKFWNKGTNGNDFHYSDLLTSITDLCNELQVNPYEMTLHNLEFGVNIKPAINASKIAKNVICYKNTESIKAIGSGIYFIEFPMQEYFVKLYDKGLQARMLWGIDIGNVLRFEIKAMRQRYFADAGIKTVADLLNVDSLKVLGKKINKVFGEVVFDDHTIDPDQMTAPDRKVYTELCNPRKWAENKENRTSTIVARENRFRAIVGKYGGLKLHSTLSEMINRKCSELMTVTPEITERVKDFLNHCQLCRNSYLIYTHKTNKVPLLKTCLSCGRDISDQKGASKYCSAKFVGEKQAHKCRNDNSNPRNNFTRQLGKINARGQTLFPITEYLRAG